MDACTIFRESSIDTKLVDDDTTYYGILQDIFEVDYGVFTKVVFNYHWVRMEDKVKGSYVDRYTNSRFANFEMKHWNLVLEPPIRSYPNKNAYEDPFVFTGVANEAPSISITVGDDGYWNEDAQANDEYWDQYAEETT
ncbi:hypothetical protein MKW98_018584 [Papaver atlanticum]|uniref:Uncharacterized protein n=1 Tax=Papaver atlanticum TaxID=357466 RepID=A0AAD4T4Z9_9MAGN|nr:hypothetical protein MKW98_018584 [Papaver atlanticum]